MFELPLIEWIAVVLAIIYVVLAARASAWCWPFAFVSSCLWSYQVYIAYDLYFDAALNVFYAVMALVGLWQWQRSRAKQNIPEQPLAIRSMRATEHLAWIGGGALVTVLGVVLAKAYTEAALPLPDATTTVYSIIGTILLIQRKLENWLYLLAMDVVYVWLYLDRGSVLFAGLFVVYCILAVYGYLSWRQRMQGQPA